MKRGEITTDTTEIQRIVRNYYEELHAEKFENLDEVDKFLGSLLSISLISVALLFDGES